MLNILITGSNGQLGNELRRILETGVAELGPLPDEYTGAVFDSVDYDTLDITDADAVKDRFDACSYDIVINCAAFTNVDGCEENEDAAFDVNATGAKNLAEASYEHGCKIVHVSTDYVFSGNEPGERVETDEPAPKSAYGRTKLSGEEMVAKANPRHFIVRTAWLYGYVGKNFVKTMKHLGETHDEVYVVDDQFGNPTSANDLAYEILKIAITDDYGIYHMTNNDTCSWADFAAAIMQNFDLPCKVIPISSAEYKQRNPKSADRPAYSSLKNAKLAATVGDEMRSWEEALSSFVENFDRYQA